MNRYATEKNILIFSLLFHISAAIFSVGLHHHDEHFQIIEFMGSKLGTTHLNDLSWEFEKQVRPWFQILLYFIPIKLLIFLGIKSPFTHLFILRLLSSLLGFYALYRMVPKLKEWLPEKHYLSGLFLFTCTWFIPYIHARTSSENLSISFFYLGLALINQSRPFLTGILLGASYLCRVQMALAVATLWLWNACIRREKFKNLALMAIGITLAILIGVLIDYWGYNEWTFVPWNYFKANMLSGILATHASSPWWYYFKKGLLKGTPILGLPLILATLWGWAILKRHPLTWITLPFFIFHICLGHKEERFIFIIHMLSPLYLTLFLAHFEEKWALLKRPWLKNSYLTVNFMLLFIATFKSANPAYNFYKFVYQHPEIKKIYAKGEGPFNMVGLPVRYYNPHQVQTKKVTVWPPLDREAKYVFFEKGEEYFDLKDRCTIIYTTYPKWALQFNIGNWISRSRFWGLASCHPEKA